MPVSAPRNQRTLSLVFLNHDHVIDFLDTGPARDGDPTTGRAHIQNVLEERTRIDDGTPDGALIPLAMLAPTCTPTVMHPNDPMDAKYLRGDDGGWRHPGEAWLAERAKRVTSNAEASSQFAASVAQKDGAELVRILGSLTKRAGR